MPLDRLEGLRNDMSRKHRDTARPGSPEQAAGAGPVAPGRGAPCHTPALLRRPQGAPFLGPGGSEVAGGRGAGAGQTGLGIGRGEVGSSDPVRS